MAFPIDYPTSPRRLEQISRKTITKGLATIPCFEVDVDGKTLRYSASDNPRQILARVMTLFAKEPTTIPYLDSFSSDDLMLDIGGNIGLYTIYAAVTTGCRVIAIEPEALNYAELNKNIYVNDLHGRVIAYCAAVSDVSSFDKLLLGGFSTGHSHHDFAESTWLNDMTWSPDVTVSKDDRLAQGSISIVIDDLVASGAMPCPNHIKIDVDGWEHKVIAGMRKTLADARVKSVLIEIDHRQKHTDEIIDYMESLGWRYSMDQLVTNRAMVMRPERVRELRRIGKDGFNYIFFRDDAYDELFRTFLKRYSPPYTGAGKLVSPPLVVDA